jgi:flagellar hook-associated protein 3 FlgL
MVRVSERLRYDATNNRVDAVKQIADDAQEVAISGRKLRKLSDGPASSVRVFRNRTKLENIQQFRKTLDFANGYMGKSEDVLMSLSETLMRARELAVQQSNATWSEADRRTVAEEVKQLIGHCISLGNSTYADRYVFGGFQTSNPPISPEGMFVGDDGEIICQIDEDTFRSINISGRKVFDVEPENEKKEVPMIEGLKLFYVALENNDTNGVRDAMRNLDDASRRVVNYTAALGARRSAMKDVEERLDKSEEELLKDNNALEGADPIKSTLDLKRSEQALQYTLQSSAKIIQPSLLQFLE